MCSYPLNQFCYAVLKFNFYVCNDLHLQFFAEGYAELFGKLVTRQDTSSSKRQ